MPAPRIDFWTFANRAEAHATLARHGFKRLPVAQKPVERWTAQHWDDFGVEYTSFASSAGRTEDGAIRYEIAQYGRTDA